MRRTAGAITAALLITLTACEAQGDTDSKKPTPSKAATTPPPAAASPSAPDSPLTLGASQKWHDTVDGKTTDGTVAALSYKQPVSGVTFGADGLGYTDPEWAVIEVRICITKGATTTVSQGPWSLGFPDGTRITPDILEGPGLPRPQYPTQAAKVTAGDCVRGNIPVVLEKSVRPNRIIYAPSHQPEPVEWAVPRA